MQISVVNFSEIPDEEVLHVLRAINRQIAEDFAPYWDQRATLRLQNPAGKQPIFERPMELRGDAILYLWGQEDIPGALGYHTENGAGLPCGFVFTEVSEEIGEPYSVTLSHEALELIGDANVNKLAAGPHPEYPEEPDRWVLHWYEMCDAVQADSYEIDGVGVSNFVLPLYFTPGEQRGGRNDFLGRRYERKGGASEALRSFGVNPGGYVGFLDPETGEMQIWFEPQDAEAERRLKIKQRLGATRRSVRKANLPEFTAAPNLLTATMVRSIAPA